MSDYVWGRKGDAVVQGRSRLLRQSSDKYSNLRHGPESPGGVANTHVGESWSASTLRTYDVLLVSGFAVKFERVFRGVGNIAALSMSCSSVCYEMDSLPSR